MRNKAIIGISAAVLTAGLGIGAAQLASADTTTPPTATATPSQGSGHGNGWVGHMGQGARGEGLQQDLSTLASKLGVDETKLKDAIQSARTATRPTERPASGLTQAEREAARTAHQEAFAKALAKELGIDEAKVTSALQELRTEHQAARAAEDKTVLDQAVKDGKLTQDEANAVQKAADQGIVRVGHHGRNR